MGIFCIVLGIIIFVVFLAAGYAVASALVMEGLWNVIGGTAAFKLSDFLQMPTAENMTTYLVCLIIFGVLGLMFALGVFMCGLVHNRLTRKLRSVELIARRAARRGQK